MNRSCSGASGSVRMGVSECGRPRGTTREDFEMCKGCFLALAQSLWRKLIFECVLLTKDTMYGDQI